MPVSTSDWLAQDVSNTSHRVGRLLAPWTCQAKTLKDYVHACTIKYVITLSSILKVFKDQFNSKKQMSMSLLHLFPFHVLLVLGKAELCAGRKRIRGEGSSHHVSLGSPSSDRDERYEILSVGGSHFCGVWHREFAISHILRKPRTNGILGEFRWSMLNNGDFFGYEVYWVYCII